MNVKRGLSVAMLIFAVAILSACGGSSGGSSSTTSPNGDSTTTPPSNTGTTPPPDTSTGSQRPANVAGFVYVRNSGSDSISAFAINASTGALAEVAGSPFATGHDPLDLAVHPSGKFVYVPNHESNNLSAYTVDLRTGTLTSMGMAASEIGPGHIAIDPSGQFAYVTNGGDRGEDGSISIYAIDAATGALSEIPGSPLATGYAPLSMTVDPSGRYVYATLTDGSGGSRVGRVVSYSIDATTGALTSTGAANTGDFPNLFVLDPSGRFAYVTNQGSHSISGYSIDSSTGALSEVAGSPFQLPHVPISLTIDSAGRFLYIPRVDTVGNAYIAAFSIDSSSGSLSEITGSPFAAEYESPYLTISPSGRFAYVASVWGNVGSISVYDIDAQTGALTNKRTTATPTGSYNVKIDPSGRVAYSTNGPLRDPGNILAFTLNPTTGDPTFIGSVPTGKWPGEINFLW